MILKVLIKRNLIFVFFAVAAALLEMYALLFTDHNGMIAAPWFLIGLLATIIGFVALIRSYAWRLALLAFVLVAILGVDSGLIMLYEINGTAFDYSILYQASEGFGMLEGQLINFAYFVPGAILIAAFLWYGVFTALSLRGVTVSKNKRNRIVCLILSCVFLAGTVAVPNIVGYANTVSKNYYTNLLHKNVDLNKNRGIFGNSIYQFVSGPFSTSPKVAGWEESSEFYFRESVTDGNLWGVSEGNNVVLILAESLEWFPITNNAEIASELFPNFTRLMEGGIVCTNHYSREKTDISEGQSLLGHYPSRGYVCNDFNENAYPYSLPSVFKRNDSTAAVNSFHNNAETFYRRNSFHKSVGFDRLYGIEQMSENYGVPNYQESCDERNLDSDMMMGMKNVMFPASGKFFSYIISYTTHGGYYDRRTSLDNKGYYDTLDRFGVYPESDNKYENYIRTYVAAMLDLDAAIGIMLDDLQEKGLLESTTIVLYSDHNAYYDRISYRGKGITNMQSEIFHVPMIIYDTKAKAALGSGSIEKFTTTVDIVPTLFTLLGIPYYSNLYFGNSVFAAEESIIFSRAYNCFITDKFLGFSLKSVVWRGHGFDREDFAERATKHLKKLQYADALYLENFFGDRPFTDA